MKFEIICKSCENNDKFYCDKGIYENDYKNVPGQDLHFKPITSTLDTNGTRDSGGMFPGILYQPI